MNHRRTLLPYLSHMLHSPTGLTSWTLYYCPLTSIVLHLASTCWYHYYLRMSNNLGKKLIYLHPLKPLKLLSACYRILSSVLSYELSDRRLLRNLRPQPRLKSFYKCPWRRGNFPLCSEWTQLQNLGYFKKFDNVTSMQSKLYPGQNSNNR